MFNRHHQPLTINGTWAINFQLRIGCESIFSNISIFQCKWYIFIFIFIKSVFEPLECSSITKLELIGSNHFAIRIAWIRRRIALANLRTHTHTRILIHFDIFCFDFHLKWVVIFAIEWNSIAGKKWLQLVFSLCLYLHVYIDDRQKIERNEHEHELINKQTASRHLHLYIKSSQFSMLTIHNVWLCFRSKNQRSVFLLSIFAPIKCTSLQLDIQNICWFCMAGWVDGLRAKMGTNKHIRISDAKPMSSNEI